MIDHHDHTHFIGQTHKKAKNALAKAVKNLQILRLRRQALSARGRGLLKTTDMAAKAYQPILNVDRSDGFWPVLFGTISGYRREPELNSRFNNPVPNGFKRTCIKDDDKPRDCLIENVTPDMLRSNAGKDKHLDYPAPSDDKDKQRDMLMRATGGYGQQPAMYYFKTQGEEGRRGYLHTALQYWFYYSYNYQTEGKDAGGRHEGDFEHVAIVLSRKTGRPRYVFMARHDKDEARRQREPLRYYYDTLDRPKGVRQEGAHIKVYAAHGSHASYPRCDEFPRSDPTYGDSLPNDYTCLGPVKTFGTGTRLINVARSPWACCRGDLASQVPINRQGRIARARSPH